MYVYVCMCIYIYLAYICKYVKTPKNFFENIGLYMEPNSTCPLSFGSNLVTT